MWSAAELYRQGVRSTPATIKTTDTQPMEMNVYGINFVSESETVSKYPRSITATIVANAAKQTSVAIKVKRRNDSPPPQPTTGRKQLLADFPGRLCLARKLRHDRDNFATIDEIIRDNNRLFSAFGSAVSSRWQQ
jgi:hypothetical protein